MIRHINLALNHVAVTIAAHSFSSMSKNMCTIKYNVLGPPVVAIAIQGVDSDSSYISDRILTGRMALVKVTLIVFC